MVMRYKTHNQKEAEMNRKPTDAEITAALKAIEDSYKQRGWINAFTGKTVGTTSTN